MDRLSVKAQPPAFPTFKKRDSDSELSFFTSSSASTATSSSYRVRTEHVSHLVNSKNKPWATLKLLSGSRSPKQMPTFTEGESIAGSLRLNLDSGESINAITITMKGTLTTGMAIGDTCTFLEHTETLWNRSMGNPTDASEGKFTGKLRGNILFPFSFRIPKEVTLNTPPSNVAKTFRLPETFMERLTKASVQYDMVVVLARGKLRVDNRFDVRFAYVPSIRPSSPSLLRQIAYQEGSPLEGPDVDPIGWFTKHLTIRGTTTNGRAVVANCMFSLANPLSYTRGTVIPLTVTLETPDLQALGFLAVPSAITVRLRRHVSYQIASAQSATSFVWYDDIDDIETAVWWPSNVGGSEPHRRRLDGEIRLVKELKPSSAVSHFSIVYSIIVQPFFSEEFRPADKDPLLVQEIEIATMHSTSARPRRYSPPGLNSSSSASMMSKSAPTTFFYPSSLTML